MTSPGGHWVLVPLPRTGGRHDWIPAAQPPSPDGRPGLWHVVPDLPGGATRWEWFPAPVVPLAPVPPVAQVFPPPPVATPMPAPQPAASKPVPRPRPRPPVLAWAIPAFVAAVLVGVLAARSGGDDAAASVAPASTGSPAPQALVDTAVAESGCEKPKQKPTEEQVNSFLRCGLFDLYVYTDTHNRDIWVAGFQEQGHVVIKTGPNWIALRHDG